jgi:hypothetical protein
MKTKNVNKKMDGPVNLERKKNAAAENLFSFFFDIDLIDDRKRRTSLRRKENDELKRRK